MPKVRFTLPETISEPARIARQADRQEAREALQSVVLAAFENLLINGDSFAEIQDEFNEISSLDLATKLQDLSQSENAERIYQNLATHENASEILKLFAQDDSIQADPNRQLPLNFLQGLLLAAAQNNNLKLATVLLEKSPHDPQEIFENTEICFSALDNNNAEMLRLFHQKGATEFLSLTVDDNLDTIAHLAAASGGNQVIELLREVDPGTLTSLNTLGETPLVVAANLLLEDTIDTLLDCGADVNQTLRNKQTALHLMAKEQKVGSAALLLMRGADINLRDDYNKSPLDYFEGKSRDEMLSLLSVLGRTASVPAPATVFGKATAASKVQPTNSKEIT